MDLARDCPAVASHAILGGNHGKQGPLGQLTMVYQSPRAFADLAEGLIRGCAAHFGEQIELQRDDLSGGQGTCVRFVLTQRG